MGLYPRQLASPAEERERERESAELAMSKEEDDCELEMEVQLLMTLKRQSPLTWSLVFSLAFSEAF